MLNNSHTHTGGPARQGAGKSVPEISVFYPGNALMHQVSRWAGKWPAYQFTMTFAESLPEIRLALRRAVVSIFDASVAPARAMEVLAIAADYSAPESVAVYTETMHQGLELFVRSRRALLLLGPMEDIQWEALFQTMQPPVGQETETSVSRRRLRRPQSVSKTKYRKTA